MRRFFFLSATFLISSTVCGQDIARKVDSLNSAIVTTKGPELNKIINDISEHLAKLPREVAFAKAEVTLSEAQKSSAPFAYFLAMRNLSRLSVQYHEQRQALQYIQDGLVYARERADSFTLALTYFHTAEFYNQQHLLATALENLLVASTIFEALDDHRYVAGCRMMAANIHYGARNYIQAVEDCQQVITHYDHIPLRERTDEDDFQLMNVNNTLGLSYFKTNQFDKSLAAYNAAEVMARQINNEFWIGLINGNRASVYREIELFDKALESLRMDYKISLKYNETESASRAAASMAEIYLELNDMPMAERYLDSARALGDPSRYDVSAYLIVSAKVKRAKGDLAGAFDELAQYNALRDSVLRQSESLNLTKVKASYELERKQQEIEELALRNQQNRDRIRFQNLIILTIVIIVILLLALVIVYLRNVRKLTRTNAIIKRQHKEIEYKNEELEAQSTQLKEANELANTLNLQLEEKVAERTVKLESALVELDTFLYRSSHDMRRPLSTLLGLENIARIETSDPRVLRLFEMVAETVRQMDSMLLKLQMAYELEQQRLDWESINLLDLLADQVEKFKRKLPEGDIILENNAEDEVHISTNAKLLTIVIKNLLENAVYFRKVNPVAVPKIVVQVFTTAQAVQLVITDNGIGIEQQYVDRVFELYFKGTEMSKGNGLGLYLVKKAVEKLKGSVSLRSELDIGSVFTVTLPLSPISKKPKESLYLPSN